MVSSVASPSKRDPWKRTRLFRHRRRHPRCNRSPGSHGAGPQMQSSLKFKKSFFFFFFANRLESCLSESSLYIYTRIYEYRQYSTFSCDLPVKSGTMSVAFWKKSPALECNWHIQPPLSSGPTLWMMTPQSVSVKPKNMILPSSCVVRGLGKL